MSKPLEKLYRCYNKQFFSGRLPKYKVMFISKFSSKTQVGECDPTKHVIKIAKGIKNYPCEVKMTLFHEMVHAKLLEGKQITFKVAYNYHSNKFQREMLRLAKAGAFKGIW